MEYEFQKAMCWNGLGRPPLRLLGVLNDFKSNQNADQFSPQSVGPVTQHRMLGRAAKTTGFVISQVV
jgi:hypothetical protein